MNTTCIHTTPSFIHSREELKHACKLPRGETADTYTPPDPTGETSATGCPLLRQRFACTGFSKERPAMIHFQRSTDDPYIAKGRPVTRWEKRVPRVVHCFASVSPARIECKQWITHGSDLDLAGDYTRLRGVSGWSSGMLISWKQGAVTHTL